MKTKKHHQVARRARAFPASPAPAVPSGVLSAVELKRIVAEILG